MILILISLAVLMTVIWISRELVKEREAASPYVGLDKHGRPWRDGFGGCYAISGDGGHSCGHGAGHGGHGGDCGGGDGGGGSH